MNKLRRAIASLGVVAVLSTLVVSTTASAGTFNDVPSGVWYESFVEELVTAGIVDGTNNNFRPADSLNRAEALKLANEACELTGTTAIDFPDVDSDDWFYGVVQTGVANGVVSGYPDGTFKPGNMINRAEFAKMLVNACVLPDASDMGNPFSDVPSAQWYSDVVLTAYWWSVLDGYSDDTFRPGNLVNRAEAAKMTANVMDPEPREEDPEEPGESSGDIEVDLSSDSPSSIAAIPANATSVSVLEFDVSAGSDEAAEIESITIKKGGVSTLASGFQAYLYEDGDRLTSGKSLNNDTQEISFVNLNWVVPRGETRTFELRVDMGNNNTVGTVNFSVVDVDAGAGEVDGLPVTGATHGTSTTSAGTVTVEKDGTITDPKVGEQDALIGKFKLTADGEDAWLEQFGAYVGGGSISATDIGSASLYVSGVDAPIATVSGPNSQDILNFTFDDAYEILEGDTKSFRIYADLNTGRSGDTMAVYVDEKTDVLAVGDEFGFGMTVDLDETNGYDGTSCTDADGKCSFSTLEGGDITISSNGPAASDIATNGKDVVLMNFNITSVSDVSFENFEVFLDASESGDAQGLLNDGEANFTDVKVKNVDTGTTLFSPVDAGDFVTASNGSTEVSEGTDADKVYYKFTDEFVMEAGDTLNLAITADIENDTDLNGMTLVAGLSITSSLPEIRDVNNKVVVNNDSLVPTSDITGKTMTVSSPGLTVSLASTPVSQSYVKGAQDVEFACFSFQVGDSSDTQLTSLTLGTNFDANNDGVYVTNGVEGGVNLNSIVGSVRLVDGDGEEISSAKSVQSNGTVEFNNLSHWVDGGETELVCVEGDISSDAFKNGNGERVAFGITAATSITAEDQNGNTLASDQKIGLPVNDTPSTFMTVTSGGSLDVSVAPDNAKEDIVVAGTTKVAVGKFQFSANEEAFTVSKVSINNRQSGVAAANLGDYDNNVTRVWVEYPNSSGVLETKSSTLTNGTANFSGLDFFIEDDEDETLTVYADLNTVENGATSAEFVDFNIAFNEFEAIAEGSGETYKADKLDADVAASSDLDFGTMTFVDTTLAHAGSADAVTLGTIDTITVPDLNISLPVGTLVKFGAESTSYVEATDVLVVLTTAYVDGATSLVGLVANDDDGDTNGDQIYYALPGTGYLTGANRMHVYESKPVLARTSSSPSGDRNQSTTDQPFVFSITEDGGQEEIEFTMAQINAATAATTDFTSNAALNGTFTGTDALTTVGTGGIGNSAYQRETSGGTNAAGITYTFDATADLSAFNGISFWSKASTTANTLTLTVDDSTGTDQTVTTATGTAATWEFTDLSFVGVADANLDAITALTWLVTDGSAEAAATYDLDEVTLYYNKIVVNGQSSTDFDTSTDGSADNLEATLRDGSTTEFRGYWYSSTQGGDASSIATHLYPIDNDFEVGDDTTKTLALQTNTASLIEDDDEDDNVTFSIALGSSVDGTVTAGGFWWSDTNTLVRWLGDVPNSTLESNTLKY